MRTVATLLCVLCVAGTATACASWFDQPRTQPGDADESAAVSQSARSTTNATLTSSAATATEAAPTTEAEPTAAASLETPAAESAPPVRTPDYFDHLLGRWQVTGFRYVADLTSRYLWEGGKLDYTVEFLADGRLITHTDIRDIVDQWTLAPDANLKLEGEGGARVVKFQFRSGVLLLRNTDGSWTELMRA